MATQKPRSVEDRIRWMVDHEPGEAGQCANWTWKSLGGDRGNPPRWGCDDANEVVKRTKANGDLFTGTNPPRGAIVLYTSGSHGHMCLSKGGGKIMSTDPNGDFGKTGTMKQAFPIQKWGQEWAGWAIRYNGVLLHMASPGEVKLDELREGQQESASITRLQDVLNFTSIPAPGNIDLPPTGTWGQLTSTVVNAWQKAHGFNAAPRLSEEQAKVLFQGSGHTLVGSQPHEPPPPPPDDDGAGGYFHDYTGKPPGVLVVKDAEGYKQLDVRTRKPPFAGAEFHMLYANCGIEWDATGDDGIIRVKYVRDGGDETGFQDYAVPRGRAIGSPDTFLITAQHFEAGEKGRGGCWSLRCEGAIKKLKIDTRYAKIMVMR